MKKRESIPIPQVFHFKYPKLILLVLSILSAYYLFRYHLSIDMVEILDSLGYLGIFCTGLFFSFGFTTPFAIGLFAAMQPQNIVLAALVGGSGALLADLLIFKMIKISFMDEFNQLENTSLFRKIHSILEKNLAKRLRIYILYALAGIIIASPLPDELGISLLAGLTTIKIGKLAIVSFMMNTLGIAIIFLLTS